MQKFRGFRAFLLAVSLPLYNTFLSVLFKFVCIFYFLEKQNFTRNDFWFEEDAERQDQPFSEPTQHPAA